MRLAAALLLLAIAITPTAVIRLSIRRARRAEWLAAIDRVAIARAVGEPTTYRKRP
jgi:hypothetical protein